MLISRVILQNRLLLSKEVVIEIKEVVRKDNLFLCKIF